MTVCYFKKCTSFMWWVFSIMLANVEQLENLSKLPLWVMGDYES